MLKVNQLIGFGGSATGIVAAGHAYTAGGQPARSALTDKLTYSDETNAAATTANLTVGRIQGCCFSDASTAGYFAGGNTAGAGGQTTLVDKVVFSTDTTAAETSAALSVGKASGSGHSSPTDGYFLGGNTTPTTMVDLADKMVFSTEITSAVATANLSINVQNQGGLGSTTDGYSMGGLTSGVVDQLVVDKLVYSTDTTAAETSANLTQSRREPQGPNGITEGWVAGGYKTAVAQVDTCDELTYSTDTTIAQTSANLTTAKAGISWNSNGVSKGYWSGGSSGAFTDTAEAVTFSTATTALVATADLTFSLGNMFGGCSSVYH